MRHDVSPEAIAGARAYEDLHVPALFEEWADPVLDAAGVQPGSRVVDVACGTGVLARAARRRVGDGGTVVGVDPGPGMLAVAETIDPSIDWKEGVAEELPLPDASFDAVVSQFGMMFFTDRHRAVREMLRVLDDGGRIAVAVWDSLGKHAAYAREVEILDEVAGRHAGDALRAPFVLGNAEGLGNVFEEAGVDHVRVEPHVGPGDRGGRGLRLPGPHREWDGLRDRAVTYRNLELYLMGLLSPDESVPASPGDTRPHAQMKRADGG